jgi:hypothetical protein
MMTAHMAFGGAGQPHGRANAPVMQAFNRAEKKKASNRCAGLDARSAFFARVPGGKPARADHIFG